MFHASVQNSASHNLMAGSRAASRAASINKINIKCNIHRLQLDTLSATMGVSLSHYGKPQLKATKPNASFSSKDRTRGTVKERFVDAALSTSHEALLHDRNNSTKCKYQFMFVKG